jgi:hypothetical protein
LGAGVARAISPDDGFGPLTALTSTNQLIMDTPATAIARSAHWPMCWRLMRGFGAGAGAGAVSTIETATDATFGATAVASMGTAFKHSGHVVRLARELRVLTSKLCPQNGHRIIRVEGMKGTGFHVRRASQNGRRSLRGRRHPTLSGLAVGARMN